MDDHNTSMNSDAAERRFAMLLDEARLPRFTSSRHDPDTNYLELTWDHGFTLYMDLTREMDPIDGWERAAILGQGLTCECDGAIHVYVPGSADDPRAAESVPSVESTGAHRCIRTTSPRSDAGRRTR